jgi:diguanylate cyclase (GGDEF)-like protein/PAS domain S-box-containing protein
MKKENNGSEMLISLRHAGAGIYFKHILLTMLVVAPAAASQAMHYYGGFELRFFFVPLMVSVVVGTLLGRSALLKLQLRDHSEQFRAIVDLAQEFTYFRRLDGRYEYVSPACERMTGYAPEEFYHTPNLMDLLIHPEDRERWANHLHSINDGGKPESFDLRLIARDNRVVWFNHVCAPVYDERGQQVGVRSTNLDVTGRKEDEARIERMAFFDPLTELPNRRSLVRHIRDEIVRAEACGDHFAILFLDLNRFKNINDSFGHSFGDRLLRQIAERLRGSCHNGCMVSRFGGDEFVILLRGVAEKVQAAEVAKRLLLVIEQPLELDGIDLHVSGSIGIAFYPEDGEEEDTLIRNADVAMYKTKKDSSGNIRVYSADFSDEATHFVTTESKIQKGILNNEFVAYYQPKVDIRSGKVIGMEALARWQHPQQGLISPGEFIPVAEETGQITALGRQILEQVLADILRWQEEGVAVPVAINVSARQFADHEYCQELVRTIRESGCAMSLLEVEITEQVFLGDIESATERLRYLRGTGLTIALDDFGTGYSSFNYIKQLPIDTLKIDRSFISHIDSDQAEYAIVKALVSLCRDLRLNMVVEGVETPPQREALVSLGCDKGQGYHFFRPMPQEEAERLLLKQSAVVV